MFRCLTKQPSSKVLVITKWKSMENLHVHNKLEHLKAPLKVWNHEKYEIIDYKIELLFRELQRVDKLGEPREF